MVWGVAGYVVAVALFAIYSRYHHPSWYPIAKPLPVLGLVAVFSAFGVLEGDKAGAVLIGPFHFYHLFAAGLSLGLLGDFLLLKRGFFVPGLASFLGGHVCYLLAYNTAPWSTPVTVQIIIAIGGIAYGANFTRRLRLGGRTGYFYPVWVYLIVICVMLASAISFDVHMQRRFMFQAAGALLFCISDAILAWDRMIRPFVQAQFWILGTYYTAQTLMTIGAIDAVEHG